MPRLREAHRSAPRFRQPLDDGLHAELTGARSETVPARSRPGEGPRRRGPRRSAAPESRAQGPDPAGNGGRRHILHAFTGKLPAQRVTQRGLGLHEHLRDRSAPAIELMAPVRHHDRGRPRDRRLPGLAQEEGAVALVDSEETWIAWWSCGIVLRRFGRSRGFPPATGRSGPMPAMLSAATRSRALAGRLEGAWAGVLIESLFRPDGASEVSPLRSSLAG